MTSPSSEACAGCGQINPLEGRLVRLEGAVGDLATQLSELLDIAEKAGAEISAREQRRQPRHGMHLVRGERQ